MEMAQHTQTMNQHMDAVQSHHTHLGGALGTLYDALALANKLVEDLNAAYAELANGHAAMGEAVTNANSHAANMDAAAGQLAADAGSGAASPN